MVFHSKDELIAQVHSLSERALADGVLLDLPRTRRREQGNDPEKQVRINWPGDQKKRFAQQYDRFVQRCGKEDGIELLLRQLESLTDSEIEMLHEDEHDFDDEQIRLDEVLPEPVFGLVHDLAYDILSRPRFQYRNRARWILRGMGR